VFLGKRQAGVLLQARASAGEQRQPVHVMIDRSLEAIARAVEMKMALAVLPERFTCAMPCWSSSAGLLRAFYLKLLRSQLVFRRCGAVCVH
jgi:predicted amidohydrolase